LKILIADKFEKSGIEGLKSLGCEVFSEPDAGALPGGVAAAMQRCNPGALVVRSTKVTAASFEGVVAGAPGSLRLIVRAGAGVDNIDVPAASAKGVRVCNCPGMNAVAVAELTMALLLACDRRVPEQTIAARSGQWNKKEFSKTGLGGARGLKGSTLGVVGAGAIGRAVIKRAIAFEMRVIVWSRSITREHARDLGAEWGGIDTPALHAMAAKCDAVTVHLPAAPDTNKLLGREFFAAMKPGAVFINTSRGSLVDEAALREAITGKALRAGLDVFDNQPSATAAEWVNETVRLAGVCATHHTGASTDQAQLAVAEETVRIVKVFMETGRAENCVNERA